jgi:transcriptional regulator with XRE-family HTH domain
MGKVLDYPTARPNMTMLTVAIVTAIAMQVGTGGAQTAEYYKQRGLKGYAFATYDPAPAIEEPASTRTPSEDLSHIRAVLRPTITDLARALGVSRQAIYDWQSGKQIAAENAARLADLARAADVFAAEGLTASAQILQRPIVSGKRLFDIAREGGSAEEAARKLIQMMRRELRQRQMLAERLANRKRLSVPSDSYEIPMLDELG